jgi:hypothetical protein
VKIKKEEIIMANKIVSGVYLDEQHLIEGAKGLKSKGIPVKNVYSPFPIHGIDPLIGVPRTRLAICSFLYGVTGFSLAILMMWYMMIEDWPANIGGKPSFALYMNLPAFIPITFEITVLCAAHLMVLTYFLRSKLLPGVIAVVPDLRVTDDRFVMQVAVSAERQAEVENILKSSGAIEIKY